MTTFMRLSTGLSVTALAFALAACAESAPPSTSSSTVALTDDQCMYFAEHGTTTICHATSSERYPLVEIRVATAACVNAHADHAGDFIAVDHDCGPDACLPVDAPCDATLPCCDGLTCDAGQCVVPPVTCVTEDFEAPEGQSACSSDRPSVTMFGGLATTVRTVGSSPLQVYVPGDENCELNLGACSSFALDTAHPILAGVDNGYAMTTTFDRTMLSYTVGKLYGSGVVTVRLYLGDALVLTDSIDRTLLDCLAGSTRTWAPAGGFDRVVTSGASVFAFTELETCF